MAVLPKKMHRKSMYQKKIIPALDDLDAWGLESYSALFRSLYRYGALFGHWVSFDASVGQMLCVRFDTQQHAVVMEQVWTDGERTMRNEFATIQFSKRALDANGERATPGIRFMRSKSASSEAGDDVPVRLYHLLRDTTKSWTFTGYGSELPSTFVKINTVCKGSIERRLDCFCVEPITNETDVVSTPAVVAVESTSRRRVRFAKSPFDLASIWHRVPLHRCDPSHFYISPTIERFWLPNIADKHADADVSWVEQGLPPSQLYQGKYGPHDFEILYIYYHDFQLIGMKVLGDNNVWAGRTSFRVDLRTDNERNKFSCGKQSSEVQLMLKQLSSTWEHQSASCSAGSVYRDINNYLHYNCLLAAQGVIDAAAYGPLEENENPRLLAHFAGVQRYGPHIACRQAILMSRPGQCCLAGDGFRLPELMPMVCHFHADADRRSTGFTIDFLNTIEFCPFTCDCPNR